MFLPLPDQSYDIEAAARLRLQPTVDANALERLLQYFPAESRGLHLEMFSVQYRVVDGDRRPDITTLDALSDPVLQGLLEELREPYWAAIPDADLEATAGRDELLTWVRTHLTAGIRRNSWTRQRQRGCE